MSDSLIVRRSGRAISLTALIDVVFILLMFFMLTSSFDRFGFLEFKTASSNGNPRQHSQSVLLLANGDLVSRTGIDKQPLSDISLLSGFDALESLAVVPESDATVQTMVLAIERLKRLGLDNVTLGHVFYSQQEEK